MDESGKKILIVDDDKDVVMLLSFHLEMAGYSTITALDGRKALAAATHNPLRLVILDLMLPEFNGWEICRCLRRDPKSSEVPVLIVSALSDDESRTKALEAGADDYMTKPFSPRELVSRALTLMAAPHRASGA